MKTPVSTANVKIDVFYKMTISLTTKEKCYPKKAVAYDSSAALFVIPTQNALRFLRGPHLEYCNFRKFFKKSQSELTPFPELCFLGFFVSLWNSSCSDI